ncbi:polyribonucleotide nucleotidyltransferase [Aquihabitans sp. McL0605]|uniref:polyribonucleotide nucleotidyltransferase n=1 Tax=Aquihabitans sp. McL0605 TaxID=3415671 RepID=UPI003CE702BB
MAEVSVSGPVSGTDKVLTLSTGVYAPQSQGAVVAKLGNTQILATANGAKEVREGTDFFPLTIDVEEKAYAAGKIPGSFFRKEGRPSDNAVLVCRLIDRPLRPSFPKGYRNETQVVITVQGADQVNPYDVVAINAASAALMLTGLPFEGPIGGVRLAYSQDGQWIPYPTFEEQDEATFQIVVAGREVNGEIAIMMVEASGTEKAWTYYEDGAPKVTESVIAGGLDAAKVWIAESLALQNELVAKVGRKPAIVWENQIDYSDEVEAAVKAAAEAKLIPANQITDKTERNAANDAIKAEVVAELTGEGGALEGQSRQVKSAFKELTKAIIRQRVIDEGVRMDGRGVTDLRPVSAQVGLIPTAHGTGLFQRGETQVLNVLTLGLPKMDQMLDTVDPVTKKRYMHHYNMPPYANGETGRMGGTKRREVGHGMLAERALLPLVPSLEEWPYALRLVSEVLSSNGSTSMGSVCASSLSLMDGGVPIKAAVAGIAMGLIYDGDKYVTLTDILGSEDAFGDMDFKVAGTAEFVTALQLDTKIEGLPSEVLAAALDQAKVARLEILDVMNAAIAAPRPEVGASAPKIISFEIPIDKIGEIIGPKGKVINAMQAETGADISIDDDGMIGTVSIGSNDLDKVAEAERQIRLILNPPSAEVGATYMGRVVNITKFGAFVNILPGRDGLVHISKMGGGKRIEKVEDVLELGQEIEVKVDDVDPNGKVSLTPVTPLASGGGSGDAAPARTTSSSSSSSSDDAPAESSSSSPARETVSFEDAFDAEVREEFGDLGPGSERPGGSGGGRSSGGRSGGRDGGRRGGGRR